MGRRRLAALLALTAALGGCFESDEERAGRAYMERDYATAQRLAQALDEAGNAHADATTTSDGSAVAVDRTAPGAMATMQMASNNAGF